MSDASFVHPHELASLEEARQARAIAELADESVPVAGGTMSYAGPSVWANQVCGIGLEAPIRDDELQQIVDYYDERGEPGEVELASHADKSCFVGLGRRGFYVAEIEFVFVVDVTRSEWSRTDVSGLELLRVDPADGTVVDEFVEVGARGFHPGRPIRPDETKLLRRVVEHPRTSAWIARVEGETCGVTAMECAGDVACLFATTVTPAFRRRGIQRAMMEARFSHGRDSGCRFVCIHSSAGIATERNARRLGMQISYAKAILTRDGPAPRDQ